VSDQPLPETRCGVVAILGAPNAGKSTLINSLVGAKVTIVSDKVQTTRTLVRGIAIHDKAQIVFVDTPGIFSPGKRLERAMVAAAWQGGADADFIMVVMDVNRKNLPDRETAGILKKLEGQPAPLLLVLNKIDMIRPEQLLTITQTMNEKYNFAATFMISAQKGSGVKDIARWLSSRLPQSEWIFPEDEISDMPMRLLAAEITREKLFQKLYRELPHALTVETEEWENFDNGDVKISQIIYVEREGHRKIILGNNGDMIRFIGEASRKELETIMERKVHIKLFVKVRENWNDDPERFLPWGLDFNA
jgi:GTP-binding protein Era